MAFSPPPFKVTGLNLDILQAMVVFVDERMLTLSLVSSSVWSMAIRRLLSMAPYVSRTSTLYADPMHVCMSTQQHVDHTFALSTYGHIESGVIPIDKS